MRIDRERRLGEAGRPRRLEHEHLLGRVREVILATHHMGDPGIEIVDRDGEVVEHRAVRPRDDRIIEVDVLKAGVPPDRVADNRRTALGHPQANGPLRLI